MGFFEKPMIFSCFYPCGKAGAIQIRRCQGLAVDHYGGTLGALALNRSGFCNVGGYWEEKDPFCTKMGIFTHCISHFCC